MKLTVLTENSAGAKFGAEHGLSYLIESAGEKLLFDTGHSDLFLRNAELLNINLETEVDTIVLSHGHWDHGDGLQYLDGKTLITHPASFMKRYRKNGHSNIGLKLSQGQAETKFKLVTTKDPYYILPLIMGASMFIQQKLSHNPGMDPMQAKIMQFLPIRNQN